MVMTADATPPRPPAVEHRRPTRACAPAENDTRRAIRTAALDLAMEVGPRATVDGSPLTRRSPHVLQLLRAQGGCAGDGLRRRRAPSAPSHVERPADESPLHAIRAVITETDLFSVMNSTVSGPRPHDGGAGSRPLARRLSQREDGEPPGGVGRHANGRRPAKDPRPALIVGSPVPRCAWRSTAGQPTAPAAVRSDQRRVRPVGERALTDGGVGGQAATDPDRRHDREDGAARG